MKSPSYMSHVESLANNPGVREIVSWLNSRGHQQETLLDEAAAVREQHVSNNVYFRGIIEFSNICQNDCFYCGIRRSNPHVERFTLTQREIMECAEFCYDAGYGSVVLQSGEDSREKFVDFVEETVSCIKSEFPELGITLCVGEQSAETYQRFFDAGAHRYLLRMETTVPEHYRQLHPPEMDYERRKNCLRLLRRIGYQVGTGVMILSPYQTLEHLAHDLLFMKEMDVDMVGMGPYIPHENTPITQSEYSADTRLQTSLNMIAILRLLMPDVNIAATTALQGLDPSGREKGLAAGANVIMPIATPQQYRDAYQLYQDKPCVNESSNHCLHCITGRIKSTGLTPVFGELGDSRHFFARRRAEHKSAS